MARAEFCGHGKAAWAREYGFVCRVSRRGFIRFLFATNSPMSPPAASLPGEITLITVCYTFWAFTRDLMSGEASICCTQYLSISSINSGIHYSRALSRITAVQIDHPRETAKRHVSMPFSLQGKVHTTNTPFQIALPLRPPLSVYIAAPPGVPSPLHPPDPHVVGQAIRTPLSIKRPHSSAASAATDSPNSSSRRSSISADIESLYGLSVASRTALET